MPLYLTGGVMLTAAYRPYLGFWGAASVAVAICTLTKALSTYALHESLGRVRGGVFVYVSFLQACDAASGAAPVDRTG